MVVMLANKETHKVSDFVEVRSMRLQDNGTLRLVTPEYTITADLEDFIFQVIDDEDYH